MIKNSETLTIKKVKNGYILEGIRGYSSYTEIYPSTEELLRAVFSYFEYSWDWKDVTIKLEKKTEEETKQ